MTHTDLWFLSRATGVVSIVAMTAVFVLGMLTSSRLAQRLHNRTLVMGLHRTLALGMSVFLVCHIVTAIVTGYVNISWLSVVLPFTSGYETLWVGLGSLAVDTLIAVIATSLLRHRISRRAWRSVHWLTYALWPMALAHGVAMGTSNEPALRWTTLGCAVVGLLAVAVRVLNPSLDSRQRSLANAQEWS